MKTALKNKFRVEPGYYEFLLYHEDYDDAIASLGDVTEDFVEERPEDYDDDYGWPVIVKDENGLRELCSTYLHSIVESFKEERPEFITESDWVTDETEKQIKDAIYKALNYQFFGF